MEKVDYLRKEEVSRFLEKASSEGARNDLLCRLPLFTGCRVGESASLSIGDCEPRLGQIKLSKVVVVPRELTMRNESKRYTSEKNPLRGEATYTYDPNLPLVFLLEDRDGYTGKKLRLLPKDAAKEFAGRQEVIKEGLKASQPTRVVPLADHATRSILADWIEGQPSNGFVFRSQKGGRLQREAHQRTITRIMLESGIPEPKAYPHILRHTYAVHFLKKTRDVVRLSRILGHTNIKTTSIYLRFVVEDLMEVLEQAGDLYR